MDLFRLVGSYFPTPAHAIFLYSAYWTAVIADKLQAFGAIKKAFAGTRFRFLNYGHKVSPWRTKNPRRVGELEFMWTTN